MNSFEQSVNHILACVRVEEKRDNQPRIESFLIGAPSHISLPSRFSPINIHFPISINTCIVFISQRTSTQYSVLLLRTRERTTSSNRHLIMYGPVTVYCTVPCNKKGAMHLRNSDDNDISPLFTLIYCGSLRLHRPLQKRPNGPTAQQHAHSSLIS